MAEENNPEKNQNLNEEKQALERQQIRQTYKNRGFQQISYQEYIAQKEKGQKKRRFDIPQFVKVIIMTPFLLLFCFGLFFIPYMIYLITTAAKTATP